MDVMQKYISSVYGQIVILGVSFLLFFHHTLTELINDWSINDNYSHGFLIPLITAYMIWQKKDRLAEMTPKPNPLGLVVIAGGVMLHILANVAAELFTMRFSIVVISAGIALYLFGSRIFREIAVPIGYLVFMIPLPAILWNKIAFPLQLLASKLTADVVYFIGIPIFREGNILHLANTSLEVVDACSGLRSLTSLLALSAAFAYITPMRNLSRWLLFLSAVPIAIFVNLVRLTATAIMAHYIGEKAAQGFLHDASGMVVFVLAFIILFFLSNGLIQIEKRLGARPPEMETAS